MHQNLERSNRDKGDGRCNSGTKRAIPPPSNPQSSSPINIHLVALSSDRSFNRPTSRQLAFSRPCPLPPPLCVFFAAPTMVDRSVWYHLPDELTERVMASLPASSVIACRCVCKHWNSLLRSHSFLRLSARLSFLSLWFIVYRSGHSLAAFSPLSHRWRRLPLPFLDPSLAVPLVSSRGLLCLLLRHSRYPTLLVCNPLASSHRLLPLMCHIRYFDIVGMVFSTLDGDEASGFYRILVTGTAVPATHETVTELYDSRTGQWCLHCRSDQDFL